MHGDAVAYGKNDFMCTNTVQALIRNDRLFLIVNMRSNDAIYGYKNDYAWHKYVQDQLVEMLYSKYNNLKAGPIYWQVGSLHIYPRHFKLVEEA
jgi:thymidylate synthase